MGRRVDVFTWRIRIEQLTIVLKYWNIGAENYNNLMRQAAGKDWGWMQNFYRYRDVPHEVPSDVTDPVIESFRGIFRRR